jgi:hypothetical protein
MKEAFVFPEVAARTDQRPRACPRCGQVGMGCHRRSRRPLVNPKVSEASVVQYQCGVWRFPIRTSAV